MSKWFISSLGYQKNKKLVAPLDRGKTATKNPHWKKGLIWCESDQDSQFGQYNDSYSSLIAFGVDYKFSNSARYPNTMYPFIFKVNIELLVRRLWHYGRQTPHDMVLRERSHFQKFRFLCKKRANFMMTSLQQLFI